LVLLGVSLIVWVLPRDVLVRATHREAAFLAWSLLTVGITAGLMALDGGVASPFTLLFFPVLTFTALSFPLRSVVVVGVATELAFVGVGGTVNPPRPELLAFFAGTLAVTAVLCAWIAQAQEGRRRELVRVSRSDPLTGALNRRGFEERVSAELDQAVRSGQPLAVVMLDFEHFKAVNDTQGHAAGDELLRWGVGTIQGAVRRMDAVGRVGGDEFAILLADIGHADALQLAERVRGALAPRVSATVGVAAFPAHGVDQEELLRYADKQLYARREGRHALPAGGRRELSWATALARAVDLRMRQEHSTRVAELADGIAAQLGWSGQERSRLRIAGMLHDIGKVSVPDSVLRKPEPLTDEEGSELRRHVVVGADLLGRIEGLEPIVPWIRHSEENVDGSGYPDGLSGDAVPIGSRIIHVADSFAALVADSASDYQGALAQLSPRVGTELDEACFAALGRHLALGDGQLQVAS
jgi:diguanylate cyclase (GGDEF)-like protein